MKEKLQEYALIAEIIGGIGIIASLIFVGLEIHDNSRIAEINAFQDLVTEMMVLNRMQVENPELRAVEVKVFRGDEQLSDEERNILSPYLRAAVRMGQLAFIQYQNEVIDERKLQSALAPVTYYMGQEETRSMVPFFNDEQFEKYLTDYIDNEN